MRLVFMGTPDFAVPILKVLCDNYSVVAVYTQPPRAAGRGQQERPSPVHQLAEQNGIPVFTPSSLKQADVQSAFVDHEADAAVVEAYGLILPQAILGAPRLGCINVHASLLPRWRGAAPIQRAIMAGDKETGITIMDMEADLDTGAMYKQESVPIDESTTAGSLHDVLAILGAKLIIDVLAQLEQQPFEPTPQPDKGVTYAEKIDKVEAKIDFDRSAQLVLRHIHGLSPYPGAFTDVTGERIKLFTVEQHQIAEIDSQVSPGTIVDDVFTIACADGAIRPRTVQRAGKSPMATKDFLRGFKLRPGTRLG